MTLPEISVAELAELRSSHTPHVLLDVREQHEWDHCRIDGAVLAPLSALAQQGLAVLGDVDQEQYIVVQCHHGGRSAQVAGWLLNQGFAKVANLAGGIDAWSREIDADVPRY